MAGNTQKNLENRLGKIESEIRELRTGLRRIGEKTRKALKKGERRRDVGLADKIRRGLGLKGSR